MPHTHVRERAHGLSVPCLACCSVHYMCVTTPITPVPCPAAAAAAPGYGSGAITGSASRRRQLMADGPPGTPAQLHEKSAWEVRYSKRNGLPWWWNRLTQKTATERPEGAPAACAQHNQAPPTPAALLRAVPKSPQSSGLFAFVCMALPRMDPTLV